MPTKFINLGSILLDIDEEVMTSPGTTISFRMRGVVSEDRTFAWDGDVTDIEIDKPVTEAKREIVKEMTSDESNEEGNA